MSNAKLNDITTTSSDVWQCLFYPKSVAVIGASESPGSWGNGIMLALLESGSRRICPVNPKAGKVLGLTSYKSILDIPDAIDLAIIVVAGLQVQGVLEECIRKKVKAAIIISAGFAEMGDEGRRLESNLVNISRRGGLRFIGPNCMGHANTFARLSTFILAWDIKPGPVAITSQSGNLTIRIIRKGINSGLGFSKVISTGNEADLRLEDCLEYLSRDEETKIITAYIEGLREGRRFFRLAKDITTRKPIIVIKGGGSTESAKAVRSHTGALAGSDAIFTGVCRQAGVIKVDDDDELSDVAFALLHQPLPPNKNIGILTLGGGLGVMTAEACEKEGLKISPLLPSTLQKLDACLPPRWSHGNPIDMVGISAAEFSKILLSLWALMEDDNIGAVLLEAPVMLDDDHLEKRMHLNPEEIKAYREKDIENLTLIRQQSEKWGKPVIFIEPAPDIANKFQTYPFFHKAGIPYCPDARRAARLLHHLSRYHDYLHASR
ncbi:MAG: CoA-binding protein [Dehalococcoidales bacterium]|nr:CoA-binding protein [Dehalococcoidales bacterium]